jgi:hypothetical protein
MANQPFGSESSKKNRSLRELMEQNNGLAPGPSSSVPKDDPWGDEPKKAADLDATSDQEHDEIVRRLRSQQGIEQRAPRRGRDDEEEEIARAKLKMKKESPVKSEATSDDAEKLAAENEELRNTLDEQRAVIAELKQCLEETTTHKKDDSWADREKEYEALLEEKSEKIRELFVRQQELEKELAAGGGGGRKSDDTPSGRGEGTPDNEELLALSDELERERCQLEQERRQMEEDRRQLREDEDSMMRQMREMELQMAKERAELARQRNELQRLHSEIRHELELAQRDAAVNERLRLLQRRHQEVEQGGGGGPPSDEAAKKKSKETGKPEPKKESGTSSIMKRFFGGGK